MTKQRKEYTFYAVVVLVALLNEVATYYGIQAVTMLPMLLVAVFVGFWAFDVK